MQQQTGEPTQTLVDSGDCTHRNLTEHDQCCPGDVARPPFQGKPHRESQVVGLPRGAHDAAPLRCRCCPSPTSMPPHHTQACSTQYGHQSHPRDADPARQNKTFVNVGANKGYSSAMWMSLYASEVRRLPPSPDCTNSDTSRHCVGLWCCLLNAGAKNAPRVP